MVELVMVVVLVATNKGLPAHGGDDVGGGDGGSGGDDGAVGEGGGGD